MRQKGERMEVLRRQIVSLSEQVKAVEASLYESGKAARKGLLKDDLEPFKRLSELVDDLCRAQQVGDSVLSWNREDNFGQMLEWLSKATGSDVSRVTVARTGGSGYGVFASQEIAVDDDQPLIKIPVPRCIGPGVRSAFIIGQCISTFPLPDNLKMAAFLMSEASNVEKSQWKAYLKSLPTKHETILHLDTEAAMILRDSLYFEDIVRRFCSMCKHYINCVAAIDLSEKFSKGEKNKFADAFAFNLFRWALDIVMTRGNALPLPDPTAPEEGSTNRTNSVRVVLIPLLDMLNHHQNASKFGVVESESSGIIVSTCELRLLPGQSLHKDQEVVMNYSSLSVKERFLNHGFLTPNEGILQISIDVNLDGDLPELAEEPALSRLIQKCPDGRSVIMAEFEPEGRPTQDTLRILRFVTLKQTGSPRNGQLELNEPLLAVEEKFPYMLIVKTATALLKRPVTAPSSDKSPLQQLCLSQIQLERQRLQAVLDSCSPTLKSLLNDIVTNSKRNAAN